jgi:hypothetical protein
MPLFSRYIGIDYSGAETPNASLKGLRVYVATDELSPVEVPPQILDQTGDRRMADGAIG